MAWRTINNPGSRLRAAIGSTGSFTLLYARRQVQDLNADSAELELQGSNPSRIAGIVSSGNGTDFYGHATVGTTWVGAKTGYVASTVNQWTWRLIIGDGTSLRFFSAPDDATSAWTEWPDSPLTQTVFSVDDLFLGGNGREGCVIDFGLVRLWSSAKTPSALVAERASPSAIDTTNLVVDKLGIGDSLSASLAAGTGTLTAQGTISLNADLPSSVIPRPDKLYPSLVDVPSSQYAAISQPQPALKTPVQFGDLDTVVMRLTDVTRYHHYSTWQAFSADQSRLLLNGSGGHIYDTSDWSVIRSTDPGYVMCFFDPVDPDIIWGHDGFGGGNRIYRYSVSANSSTSYTVPAASGSYNGVSIGAGEGSISADGKYLVLVATKSGSDDRFVIVWDAENNQVDGTLTLSGWGSDLDNAMISPSGDWIVLASLRSGERGHRIYDRATLTFQRAYTGGSGTNSSNGFTGHMDIGYRTNGDEVMVRQRNDGGMVTVRLSDGNERLEIPGSSFSWGNHISCRNIHRPGYAYVSMSYQSDQTTKPLYREIFSVKLDGSGQIERWGQAMFPNNGDYDLQAKATPSPDGDMVLFTSGWGTTVPREYVLYVPVPTPPETTKVTIGGRLQVDPIVTVEASASGDVVSYSGEYSSISETPTITATLKSGGSTVDTDTPTLNDGEYSGSFTSVSDGTYTVEVSISDSETSAGGAAVSGQVTVESAAVPPATPTDLAVTAFTSTTVTLSWTDLSESDSFQVEMAYGGPDILWAYTGTTEHTWQNLAPETTYGFRVRAQKGGLWSDWSAVVEQTTKPAIPAAPSITATTLSDSAIRIDWSDVGVTDYKLYRKASPTGQRTLIYSGSGLTYTDTGLAEGTPYYYDVSATNITGTTFSSVTSGTTLQSDGPGRLIVHAPAQVDIGQAFEVTVQAVTGRGDGIGEVTITLTPSLSVTGDLTAKTDLEGNALFILTATEAGALTLAASDGDTLASSAVVQVAPEEDAATIAARLAAAEKKSTRTNRKPSPPPLDISAPPLELEQAESVSPLAELLNAMLMAPPVMAEPISLSEFMPPPQMAPPPPSSGMQKAIEALDQAIATQMKALHDQLQTLNRLIE